MSNPAPEPTSPAGEARFETPSAWSEEPFSELPELIPPFTQEPSSSWNFIALGLSLLLIALVLWGAWQLRQKRPKYLSPLEQARQKLAQLAQGSQRSQETATRCSQILCQAWAAHYREHLLNQPPLLILQKYAFLHELPHPLHEPLLLFLAQGVDLAYRPEKEILPNKDLIEQTRRLLELSEQHPPSS